MGTTMHAHIEVKTDGKWLHYGCPDITRDYLLFACVNGTRKETFETNPKIFQQIQPVARIHILPNDMSYVTKICYAQQSSQYKCHNYGVLESADLFTLQRLLSKFDTKYDLEENVFKTYINNNAISAHDGFDDVRVIFWFDH